MWGWTGEINIFILLIPVMLLIISLINLLPMQPNRFFWKISDVFFTYVEKNISILFILFVSLIEVHSLLSFLTLIFQKDWFKKAPSILA